MNNINYRQYINNLYDLLVDRYIVITINNEYNIITNVYNIDDYIIIQTKYDTYMINNPDNTFLDIQDIIKKLGLIYNVTVIPMTTTARLLKENYDNKL